MKKVLIIILIIIFTSTVNSWCWDDQDSHPRITEYTATKFFDSDLLKEDLVEEGVTHRALDWLREGSRLEDQSNFFGIPTRSLNHFHNPTKPVEQAGLNDLFSGMSSILWAQNRTAQSGKTGGDWSWQMVRDHQYNYLTSTSKADEDANLARLLKGLGYQMHLIQDMSQPNHVRNDTHIADGSGKKTKNGFEIWAKKNPNRVNALLSMNDAQQIIGSVSVDLSKTFANYTTMAPVARLSDTRDNLQINTSVTPNIPYITPSVSFSQGLAEYTNANFFSEDTFFAAERYSVSDKHYFPYPQKAETDLQKFINKELPTIPIFDINKTYQTFAISKKTTSGEVLNCLVKPDWNTADIYRIAGEGEFFYGSFIQDEVCFEEQAGKLLPRAVGYSKAMLDYFFRGELTVTVPTDTPPTSSRIRLKVRNSTSSGELMTDGSIDLMVIYRQYKKDSPAASGNLIPDGDYQFRKYTLSGCPEDNPRCKSIDTVDNLFDFDLSGNPLPPLARDISLVVVYRGKLGTEPDSVVFEELPLDGVAGDIQLALPARGVYASTSDSIISGSFDDFALAARNTSNTTTSGPGTTELLVIYRQASSDPFQSQPVDSSENIKYVSATINTPQGISSSTSTELPYSLSSVQIPIMATDVYVYLIHTAQDGSVTHGYFDISEPTPIDVFNNADKVCINNQWYNAGSPEAIALVDSNKDGIADLADVYAHNIANIFAKISSVSAATLASTNNYTFQAPDVLIGGNLRRLGFVLTDYSFKYSFKEDWLDTDTHDPWIAYEPATNYPGTAVKNQTYPDGTYHYPGMYNMRGNKMWWGGGLVWENDVYPEGQSADASCSWEALSH